jgi:hypothetical protein
MNAVINIENYPECCQLVADSPFWVKDKKHEMAVVCDNSDYDVEVRHTENEVAFLPIDGCVYLSGGSEKRCDFAVAGSNNTYFIEIKELERFDLHKKKNAKKVEARKQLAATINDFKAKHQQNLNLKNTIAFIALLPKYREEPRDILKTKEITNIDKFFEMCGCPNIYEGEVIKIK